MTSLTTSLPSEVMLLGPGLNFPPKIHPWKGIPLFGLAALVARKQSAQLSLFEALRVLPEAVKQEIESTPYQRGSGESVVGQFHDFPQFVQIGLGQANNNPLDDSLHVGSPSGANVPLGSDAGPETHVAAIYGKHLPDVADIQSFPDCGTEKSQAPNSAIYQVDSSALPHKSLPLDFILGPKGSSLSERVCARLVQLEAHEGNPSLRSDYRQAMITVSLASKGNTMPFVVASYTVQRCHPAKVWPRIIAERKAKLGKEYDMWYTAEGIMRPDVIIPDHDPLYGVPILRKPPTREPEHNERIAALLSSAEGFTHNRAASGEVAGRFTASKSVEYSADSTSAGASSGPLPADTGRGTPDTPSIAPRPVQTIQEKEKRA